MVVVMEVVFEFFVFVVGATGVCAAADRPLRMFIWIWFMRTVKSGAGFVPMAPLVLLLPLLPVVGAIFACLGCL